MLKTTRILLIFLLRLLHGITCNEFDDIHRRISYLSEKMGACKEYFHYQLIDGFINGKLELPHIKLDDTIQVTFYRDKVDVNEPRFNGILLPAESSQTVINKIQNGQLILFRVDFPLTRKVPELNKISVNANKLCTTEHESTEDLLVLKYTMKTLNGSLPVFSHNINIPNFDESPNCGQADKAIAINGFTPLVYGGSETVQGEYPWLTAIYKKQRTGLNFLCGGSLITSKIIVTAAHCFQGSTLNADRIVAVLGRYNLSNYLEDSYVIKEIEDLILHPDYKSGLSFSDADLALLKMKNYVRFTQFIKPICLWFGTTNEGLITNQTAVVAGWGSDEDGNTLSVVPKKVKIDIVSEDTCIHSSPAFMSITTSRTLCAGNRNGSGLCEGDSGGGLMINRYGRWMLRGVVSGGLTNQKRCSSQEYTVYCDVEKHTKWLEKYVGKEKLTSGSVAEICGISGKDLGSQYPWLAAIYRKRPTGIRFTYTGSLISSRTVLASAAALVTVEGEDISADNYRLYFGRYDLNDIQENEVLRREVATIIFHPDFNKWDRSILPENGIAIIQLKDPVGFTEYVKPICLWTEPNDGHSYIAGQSATLTSWDITGVHDDSFTIPTSIKVNTTSIQQCQLWGYDESMSSLILCVPRLENEIGGILMVERNERWLLLGINALRFDYDTFMSKDYFAYFDLTKYLPWIKKNLLS